MTQPDSQYHHSVYNYATGPVGIQAAIVNGAATSPTSSGTADLAIATVDDLRAALADYRDQLDRAARAIDRDTDQAARAELDAAQTALSSTDPRQRRQAVLALKRLRGLAPTVSGLAAKAAGLAAAADRLL